MKDSGAVKKSKKSFDFIKYFGAILLFKKRIVIFRESKNYPGVLVEREKGLLNTKKTTKQ